MLYFKLTEKFPFCCSVLFYIDCKYIIAETPVNEAIKYRARSNSAESWSSALKLPEDGPKRHSSVHEETNQQKGKLQKFICLKCKTF